MPAARIFRRRATIGGKALDQDAFRYSMENAKATLRTPEEHLAELVAGARVLLPQLASRSRPTSETMTVSSLKGRPMVGSGFIACR